MPLISDFMVQGAEFEKLNTNQLCREDHVARSQMLKLIDQGAQGAAILEACIFVLLYRFLY